VLAFQDLADIVKRSIDVSPRVTDLADSRDIRKLLAAFFEQNDCLHPAQSPLEQTDFVNNVCASDTFTFSVLVLGGHEKESNLSIIEHFSQPLFDAHARGRLPIKDFPFKT